MGLDKAIKSGKEHRKQYRGAKAVDTTCRNHGSDPWSRDDRLYSSKKRRQAAENKLKERL